MHGSEMLVFRTDTDDLINYLDGIRVFGVETCDECIGLACLYHHHAKVVALEHLVISLLEGVAFTLTLLCEDAGITLTAFLLGGMAQIDNLNSFK